MSNYNIKLNLQGLQGAFITKLQGRTATKTCLCIPVEDAGLYVGEKGTYLTLSAVEMREQRYDDTHCIKPQVSKERYQSMTDEERKGIPIIGGMSPMKPKAGQQVDTITQTAQADGEDVPF